MLQYQISIADFNNKENATAKDFMALINEVIRIVDNKFGVVLEPEVKFLGTFDSE